MVLSAHARYWYGSQGLSFCMPEGETRREDGEMPLVRI